MTPLDFALAGAPDWRTRTVTASDGHALVVRTLGSGRPLLMLHGGLSNAALYGAVAQALASRREVHLLERRNSGVSAASPIPHDFAVEARDVIELLGALGPPADLFGHSAGAIVALMALDAAPALIARLALYEPPVTAGGEPARTACAAFRSQRAADWRAALVQALLSVGGAGEAEAEATAALIGSLDPEMRDTILDSAERQLEGLGGFEFHPQSLARAEPLLLIEGETSVEHPLQASNRLLAAAAPRARRVRLPGQGHTANLTAPAELAQVLAAFFDDAE